jgi:hypothetical protein
MTSSTTLVCYRFKGCVSIPDSRHAEAIAFQVHARELDDRRFIVHKQN